MIGSGEQFQREIHPERGSHVNPEYGEHNAKDVVIHR